MPPSTPPFRLIGQVASLRAMTSEDADGPYFDWLHQPSLIALLESMRRPVTREQLRAYLQTQAAAADSVMFGVCANDTGALVGTIKLSAIDWVGRIAAIGLLIGDASARGRGIGPDILRLMCTYGFRDLNLYKLHAGVSAHNTPSQRAFEKAGFTLESRRRHQLWIDGGYQDQLQYAAFRDTWAAAQD